jgi:hypothetical protein
MADADALTLGAYPWVTEDVRSAVELLTADQATEFIREVRAQYRADHRERVHTVAECDLPAAIGVDAIHDARVGRARAGAGGGRKRGVGDRPDE